MARIKNRDTAARRLSKRASEFFGMNLDEYLRWAVSVRDGRYWLNDNGSMQMCWLRLGCPANADEANAMLPRCDNPIRVRQSEGDSQ